MCDSQVDTKLHDCKHQADSCKSAADQRKNQLLEKAAGWPLGFGRRQNVAKNTITLKLLTSGIGT